jgi:hypothetical protein
MWRNIYGLLRQDQPGTAAGRWPGASGQYHQSGGHETRSPKAETRKKPEFRRPKPTPLPPDSSLPCADRVRISGFGLLSGFGLRASDLGRWELVVLSGCASAGRVFALATAHSDFPDRATADLVNATLGVLKDKLRRWHTDRMSKGESDRILAACFPDEL